MNLSSMTVSGDRPPFTALPNWLRGVATPMEGWLLWCLQSHYPNIWPSLRLISEESGICRRKVIQVLSDMEAKGWVVKEHRQREDGGVSSTHYHLTIWDQRWWCAEDFRAFTQLRKQATPGACHAPTPVQGVHGAGAGRAPKEDQEKKIKKEPPIPPKPETTPSEPEPKPARTRIKLTEADIPESLQPVAALVVQFWNQAKGGQRTQRALTGQLRELEAIARDRRGGLQAVRQQLQKAITAAEIGSAWRGITHARWLEFGLGHGQQAETRPSLPSLPPMTAEEAAHMRLLQNPPPTVFGRR